MMGDTQQMGRSTNSGMVGAGDEAGASNNRMSLDPNDPAFDFTKDWQDGNIYTLKNVQITQVSPGEFTVESAEPGTPEGEGETPEARRGAEGVAGESAGQDTSARGGTGFRNPVIANIAAEYK